MNIPRFMFNNGAVVEILSTGHYPDSFIVRNLVTLEKYETEFNQLSLATPKQLEELAHETAENN